MLHSQRLSDWLAKAGMSSMNDAESSGRRSAAAFGSAQAIIRLAMADISQLPIEDKMTATLARVFLETLNRQCLSLGLSALDQEAPAQELQRWCRDGEAFFRPQFTWLPLLNPYPHVRDWTLLHAFADLGRLWILIAPGLEDSGADRNITAAQVRHRTFLALEEEIRRMAAEPDVRSALAWHSAGKDPWRLLAVEAATLGDCRLPEGVPQSAIYVEPTLQIFDADGTKRIDWNTVPAILGTELLCRVIQGEPRLIVVMAEAAAGKSCLLRELAARCAVDSALHPVFSRWSDAIRGPEVLRTAVAAFENRYSLTFADLFTRRDLSFFFDGLDESVDQSEAELTACVVRLADIPISRQCPVIASVRAEIVSEVTMRALVQRKALVCRIPGLTTAEKELIERKRRQYLSAELTDDSAGSSSAGLSSGVSAHIRTALSMNWTSDSRVRKLRAFVSEAVAAVGPHSTETVVAVRHLIQEIAREASRPDCFPRARMTDLRKISNWDRFAFNQLPAFIRPSAFEGEVEFQSSLLRQYLLAELCMRKQLESAQSADQDAVNTLAQCAVRELERRLLDDLYQELASLAKNNDPQLAVFLNELGLSQGADYWAAKIRHVYEVIRLQAEWPQAVPSVSSPPTTGLPPGLQPLRQLVNVWDHALLATFGLYRGLGNDPQTVHIFQANPVALAGYFRVRDAVSGHSWSSQFNLSRLGLAGLQARRASFYGDDISHTNLRGADLTAAIFNSANLSHADFRDAEISRVDFTHANLGQCKMTGTRMYKTVLLDARLTGADLTGVNLSRALFRREDLSPEQLASCRLEPA
jgi:hypothetical protein